MEVGTIGAIRDTPGMCEGQVTPWQAMKVVASVNHRVVRVAKVAALLMDFRKLLEKRGKPVAEPAR
jgi:hypothetical protein